MQEGDLLAINPKTNELFLGDQAAVDGKSRLERIQTHLRGMLKDETSLIELGTLKQGPPHCFSRGPQ